jgi:hypothetical protein
VDAICRSGRLPSVKRTNSQHILQVQAASNAPTAQAIADPIDLALSQNSDRLISLWDGTNKTPRRNAFRIAAA